MRQCGIVCIEGEYLQKWGEGAGKKKTAKEK
jgi:hypothetical protein